MRQRPDDQRRLEWFASLTFDLRRDQVLEPGRASPRGSQPSWMPYSTGDGRDWVPVITLMG